VLPPQITFQSTENFDDGVADLFTGYSSGGWNVSGGRYTATPNGTTAVSLLDLGVDNLNVSSVLDLSATVNTQGRAGFIFDRYDENTFKFVAIDVLAKQVIIGHYTAKSGWVKDAVYATTITAGTDYTLGVSLKGSTVSVTLNGQVVLGYAYSASTVDGQFGLFATGGTARFDNVAIKTNDRAFIVTLTGNMLAAAPAATDANTALTQQQLDSIAAAAIVRWTETLGNGDPRLAAFADAHIVITDLVGEALGYFDGSNILIDIDAADHGWFIDVSPFDNTEFAMTLDRSTLAAAADSDAFGRMDLLTVVSHEIGHLLGFGDNEAGFAVMNEDLEAGTRILLDAKPSVRAATAASTGTGSVATDSVIEEAGNPAVPAAAVPVINWQGGLFGNGTDAWGSESGAAGWMTDFVSALGKSESERNPNAKIKLLVPQAAVKVVSDAAKRIGALFS
jgi:hypothetical protein